MPVHCLDARRPTSVAWLGRLRRLVRDRDIDVVHTHMPLHRGWRPALALPGRRPVFVHTEHNLWDRYRRADPLGQPGHLRPQCRRDGRVRRRRPLGAGSRRVPVEVVTHGVDGRAHRP